MTEKTIKDVLAEIIKDRRVNAREALDMNDKQILFIGKCYDDSISFYNGRQRENLRFQPGDESRLGRPLL